MVIQVVLHVKGRSRASGMRSTTFLAFSSEPVGDSVKKELIIESNSHSLLTT